MLVHIILAIEDLLTFVRAFESPRRPMLSLNMAIERISIKEWAGVFASLLFAN